MDGISKLREGLPSWESIATIVVIYLVTVSIYRLFLHPLARFPGPKLAAVTRYYEAYYDLIRNGQYTFKIAELHKRYGTPYELHVIDPAFYEKLYCQGRWDKYAWMVDAFTGDGATICTAPHELHKARRQPLNHFFSKTRVASQQNVIDRNIAVFCDRVSQSASTGKLMDVGAALSALTRDIACEFMLNKTYAHLKSKDFHVQVSHMLRSGGSMWRATKHIRWFGPAMHSGCEGDTKELLRIAHTSSSTTPPGTREESSRTIVHEIVDSKLPPAEKRFQRVINDVSTITGAGFETTASVLRLVFYHVYSAQGILRRLRAELATIALNAAAASSSPPPPPPIKSLEQLPYLTSVIMEGLRLSPAIGSRSARIAPDRDLFYGEGRMRIPAGTPVGMTTILMHTDETLYPAPLSFRPDRWMDAEARKRLEKTYAPFSKGTRMCLGLNLAWAEMYLIIARVVPRFDVKFQGVDPTHFDMESDQFIIGTKGDAQLNALVTLCKA
ncbi:cytochrome P450 [Apiospora rasikravindrae]|uniref:Cytochrome P450 n=1 Tax=Apiospora rasikravindrae TaxID=990691 RepID=A0ABR1RW26_9PEZI